MPLVILGTSRKHSSTLEFVEAALDGMRYNLVHLLDFEIAHYNYPGDYPSNDHFLTITDQMLKHQAIIFATPVYWYAMSGSMKVFFDRLTDLVTIRKDLGRKLKGKSTFLLAAGADRHLPEGFEVPFRSTSAYFDMHYRLAAYHSVRFPQDMQSCSIFQDTVRRHL